jgi:adenine/guanine phosphoribosyltransferase-like PRPP-binding protein
VKRILYLVLAAVVALMILVPVAMAQEEKKMKVEETVVVEREGYAPLPKSGGPAAGSVLLPAAGLLVGSGVLAYAVLRRR